MNRSAKIVVALLVIAVSAFFLYSKLASWHKQEVETAVNQEQALWQKKTDQLEQEVTSLQKELEVVKGQKVPDDKLAQVFGTNQPSPRLPGEKEKLAAVVAEVKKLAGVVKDEKELADVLGNEKKLVELLGEDQKLVKILREEERLAAILRDEKKLNAILRDEHKLVEILAEEEKNDVKKDGFVRKKIPAGGIQPGDADIERRIMAFFSYLDEQPYVQSYNFEGGTYLQYQIAVNKLSSHPPVIVGEMQSLYSLVRNVAHFYRIIGKKPIFLTRQVLQNEADVIESVMKIFYQWYTMDDNARAAMGGRASPEMMYEYAGYLLNTLGGRSYLLRRSPRMRALTTYYCVLALDRANEDELNSKGIDIRPYIQSSLLEIKNQIGLIYQKEYIAKLSELSLKYG